MKQSRSSECLQELKGRSIGQKSLRYRFGQAPHGVSPQLRVHACGFNIRVPHELWGAASLALKLSRFRPSKPPPPSELVVAPPEPAEENPVLPSGALAWDVVESLDTKPNLTLWEKIACCGAAVICCLSLWYRTSPKTVFEPRYVLGMVVFASLVVLLVRGWMLERKYAKMERKEKDLAFSNSRFVKFDGVSLHVTECTSPDTSVLAPAKGHKEGSEAAKESLAVWIHCLHGFGASCFSWSFIQKTLANAVQGYAIITAHDMPGFGLSQRPSQTRPYLTSFNSSAAVYFVNNENDIRNRSKQTSKGPASSGAIHFSEQKEFDEGALAGSKMPASGGEREMQKVWDRYASKKRVLIGHSMGACAVAEAVIRHPDAIDAVVLVAPAVVAFWVGSSDAAKDAKSASEPIGKEYYSSFVPCSVHEDSCDGSMMEEKRLDEARLDSSTASVRGSSQQPSDLMDSSNRLLRIFLAIVRMVVAEIARIILLVLTPLILVCLRLLVRSREFWERGLASAWYDKSRVTRDYVNGYRIPQLVKNWDIGIVRFLMGRLSDDNGFVPSVLATAGGEALPSQAEQLAAVCNSHGTKVLIVHGRNDSLVPIGNSRRLAELLRPHARLVEFDNCGHMPHEECAMKFVEEVSEFLNRI